MQVVKPVYFDKAINYKFLRDETSIEMLDYIIKERSIDLSYVIHGTARLSGDIRQSIYNGETIFSSIYEKFQKKIITDVQNKFKLIQD